MEEEIVQSLSLIERKVLPNISDGIFLDKLVEKSGLDSTSVSRALEFLKNKKIVELKTEEKQIVVAGINGIYYLKKGLPERRLIDILSERKSIPLGEIGNSAGLNENEARVSVGILKKKALAEIKEGRVIVIASAGELKKEMIEEKFLKKLPIEVNSLEPEEKFSFEMLKDRKEIVELKTEKKLTVFFTELGKKISKKEIDEDFIEQLSSKMISAESWKGKKFRRYDIVSAVPRVYGGKKHFVNQATDYAKRIWLDMGFKEMSGNLVESGFWNFDALFTPQDHPARELQDSFFIKDCEAKLPEKKLVDAVKSSHAGSLTKDSLGWKYVWDERPAKKVLLRVHTTVLSAQTLKKIAENKEYPAKYFALGKCFRNETVDWSHGFEFDQTEGIVVDENANFKQLLGYLVEFYKKMGYEKIRVRPHYFPYTEPSVEIDVWNSEKKKWVETGGAGMFRPEVTIPFFGRHIPVLAWGQGFSRIIMEYFGISDLREMHKNNITKLRETKFWMK
jgi:phenylalanyl-tRNA synthetase alpha chain